MVGSTGLVVTGDEVDDSVDNVDSSVFMSSVV